MAIIGYARVSTNDQNLDLQVNALRSAGCGRVFEDHGISGAVEKRRGLNAVLRTLRKGDTLVVWRLDRLGRSIRHLIDVITKLQARGVEFRSITENIDTNSAGGRMIFHVIAAMAEFERSLISERTIAGMAAARQRGQSLGRRRSLTIVQCTEALQALNQSGENLADVAKRYGVHPRTLKRLIAMAQTTGVDVS
ncbi:DNA invertase Pin-like site-specific DNA recombinase [Agrobacterium tumefaciens]|uniref:DNA invertase Pin-like site-specific DNA recombinase n=1 Tax=Agrobacterium radiobacter TaxID=362 RepID=A0ABR6J7G5_AGRRD|nr:recombinase family protein [Agrobacterium radiobacter]TGE76516.1 DNA resolvase [Rhizobium sp. SEMIA 439]MBB4283882.1 DNA invertase Pin-like site-specific DNA recombinase [Agrobacterium radiobacter]MBB4319622.1 DNA invertase Pin-like site-specific DNA recombinase [Agrobacterium radiobacter]MBB4326009.1 DNA invertase Pin-like site-specific DNA recombinase [Agrobacterium radiobacter]MBB4337846.1 DNA invertase Pin-like site-specific DNA recombinase [Agrobacterium radiobacter]